MKIVCICKMCICQIPACGTYRLFARCLKELPLTCGKCLRDDLDTTEDARLRCNLGSLSEESISPTLRPLRNMCQSNYQWISSQHRCCIGELQGVAGQAGV